MTIQEIEVLNEQNKSNIKIAFETGNVKLAARLKKRYIPIEHKCIHCGCIISHKTWENNGPICELCNYEYYGIQGE